MAGRGGRAARFVHISARSAPGNLGCRSRRREGSVTANEPFWIGQACPLVACGVAGAHCRRPRAALIVVNVSTLTMEPLLDPSSPDVDLVTAPPNIVWCARLSRKWPG